MRELVKDAAVTLTYLLYLRVVVLSGAWEVAWNPFFPLAEDGRVQLPE